MRKKSTPSKSLALLERTHFFSVLRASRLRNHPNLHALRSLAEKRALVRRKRQMRLWRDRVDFALRALPHLGTLSRSSDCDARDLRTAAASQRAYLNAILRRKPRCGLAGLELDFFISMLSCAVRRAVCGEGNAFGFACDAVRRREKGTQLQRLATI